jgi:hypothetical protein
MEYPPMSDFETHPVGTGQELERLRAENEQMYRLFNQIADLGCCGGRGGLQKAIDISVQAICLHDAHSFGLAKTAKWKNKLSTVTDYRRAHYGLGDN